MINSPADLRMDNIMALYEASDLVGAIFGWAA
jgi:hypothetical protein